MVVKTQVRSRRDRTSLVTSANRLQATPQNPRQGSVSRIYRLFWSISPPMCRNTSGGWNAIENARCSKGFHLPNPRHP